MSEPACVWCGRVAALRGVTPTGRICSACCARRRSGPCGQCGQHRRLVGRDESGRPWCERCYARARHRRLDARFRTQIVAAVHTVEPDLDQASVLAAIDAAAPSSRAVRWLATRLHGDPHVLVDGPTSTLPVLHRFTQQLVRGGAQRIRIIHPDCVRCGRRQPPHEHVGGGWLCSRCSAHSRCVPCSRCGISRPPNVRDEAGHPICSWCVQRDRHRTTDQERLEQITKSVRSATAGLLPAHLIRTAVAAVAPRRGQQRQLAADLASGGWTAVPTPVLVAGLLLELSAAGADVPAPTCVRCERAAHPPTLRGGRLTCPDCADPCIECGRRRRLPDSRYCSRCRRARSLGRRRGRCCECGREDRLLHADGRCRMCAERLARRCHRCDAAVLGLTTIDGQQTCQPCALTTTVDLLLPAGDGGRLTALRGPVLAGEPFTTRRWLLKAGPVLGDLHHGRIPLSHDSLDRLPGGHAVEHLRALLVATALLPAYEHRPATLLEHDLDDLVACLTPTAQRTIRSWARWHVLAQLRRPTSRRRNFHLATTNARRRIRQAVEFTHTLERDRRPLRDVEQTDLDTWFAGGPARHQARTFLAWAQRHGHISNSLRLPPAYRAPSSVAADPEHRWEIARRLVTDTTLDPADRVAAALVVLYAQRLTHVVALKTDDLRQVDGTVRVHLGPQELTLPEPFATLALRLPTPRRHGVADQLPGPWLFPGGIAGQHITPGALAQRLRRHGIEARKLRLAALTQLGAELPPSLLATMLGIAPTTATRWATQSGGDWATYAALPPPRP